MKKITLWHRHNAKEERFEYNHYEDGWDVSATPSMVPDNNYRWAKEHAYMDGSTVRHLNEIKQPLEEVFKHYGKPFTSGRDLWDFLTAHYNFTPKT